MDHEHPGQAGPDDPVLRAQREEMIRCLNEKYPAADRPLRHVAATEESWGRLLYYVSAM
jgi:hypothetical protein